MFPAETGISEDQKQLNVHLQENGYTAVYADNKVLYIRENEWMTALSNISKMKFKKANPRRVHRIYFKIKLHAYDKIIIFKAYKTKSVPVVTGSGDDR